MATGNSIRGWTSLAVFAALWFACTSSTAAPIDDIPDLVCPRVGANKPIRRPSSPSGQEDVPFDLRVFGKLHEPSDEANLALVERFRPGVTSANGPGIRRLAIWGDSHMASGIFGEELQRLLGVVGVDTSHSFIPPYMARRGVRIPVRSFCIGSAWTISSAYTSHTEENVGPALAELRSHGAGADNYLWIDVRSRARVPEVIRLRMLYRPAAAGAQIAVSVNQGAEKIYQLELASEFDGVAPKNLLLAEGDLLSTLRIRVVSGEVALQGFFIDKVTEPSLTFDVFGIPGATVNGWRMANADYLRAALYERQYDAVLMEFGTNEAAGNFDPEGYTQLLNQALMKMRLVFPEAACLLLGSPDRGTVLRRKRGRRGVPVTTDQLLRYSRIHQRINAIQAEVGTTFGCQVWDWQRTMGGPGSAYVWVRGNPTLMSSDLIHMTPAGYRRSAGTLARYLGWSR